MPETAAATSAERVNAAADIERRVLAIVEQHVRTPGLARAEWQMDTPVSALDFDSLEMIEAIMSIEEEFHIEIPDQAVVDIGTLGELVAAVRGRIN